jgi:hypothetical protein
MPVPHPKEVGSEWIGFAIAEVVPSKIPSISIGAVPTVTCKVVGFLNR